MKHTIMFRRSMRLLYMLMACVALSVSQAMAQSIVTGAVSGMVHDTSGRALRGANVMLRDHSSGFERVGESNTDGSFGFRFLAPGLYDITAEQLGFRPVRVQRVRVPAGGELDLALVLSRAEPPVDSVEVIAGDVLVAGTANGFGFTYSALELRRFPDRSRDLPGLNAFSTIGGAGFETEGLPGAFGGITVDGIPYGGVHRPWGAPDRFFGSPFALSSLAEAELMAGGLDVEWSGTAGSRVLGMTRSGSRRFEVRAFGDWFGDPFASSRFFEPQEVPHTSGRGGVVITGPVVRDTAHFSIGMEYRRLETPRPPVWAPTDLDAQVRTVASDSFGVNLTPFLSPGLSQAEVVTAFGRFDWQLTDRSQLTIRGNVATVSETDPVLGPGQLPAVGLAVDGRDIATGATLVTQLAPWFAIEMRGGLSTSRREYTNPGNLPTTLVPDGPVLFGLDGTLPGVFDRTDLFVTGLLHIEGGPHRLKVGTAFRRVAIDNTFRFGRAGEYVFGGVDGFAGLTGSFEQSVGRLPVVDYAPLEIAGFLQDRWRLSPGVELVAGLRIELERLPKTDVAPNAAWFTLTGIGVDTLDLVGVKLSPRVGLVWDVGNRHRWVIRAESAVHQGLTDPGVFGEVITETGSSQARRAVGSLGSWPTAPDSAVAPPSATLLTMLGPQFQSPRTSRAVFAIDGALGQSMMLHLSALYRHTEFLPRRHDLNRLQASAGTDQYGRRLYGTLQQFGPVIAATPGSNRRFPAFDVVSAFDPDGYSDYWGLTVQLDRRVGRTAQFLASYTFSQTRDNWLSGRQGGFGGQLTPFPDSLMNADWAVGRSDYDIPHRLLAALEFTFGPVRLAGVYRYRSGYPFTPGFRDGVDANGDGSARNDPAYVDDNLTGVGALFAQWPCLRRQVGRFAERNACRAPGVSSLDLRLALGPFNVGYPFEVLVDVINLVEGDIADRDRALYLVDPAGTLTRDPATGQVAVPLVVNPNFGSPVIRRTGGRMLRVGLRINYE